MSPTPQLCSLRQFNNLTKRLTFGYPDPEPMPRLPALALATLLLVAPLTGCLGFTGDDGGDEDDLSSASADGQGGASQAQLSDGETNLTKLAFPDGEGTNATIWANGTFSPEQSCYAGGCLTGSAFEQVTLDEELPDGLPVEIQATLTYDTGPTIFGQPVDLSLFSEDATFYTWENEDGDDQEIIKATVLGGTGPITTEVEYRFPTGAEPEVSYTLQIEVTAGRTLVPAGVPVAVDLGPGERLEALATGDGKTAIDLRGPSDEWVTYATSEDGRATITLPDDASSGEYVALVPSDSQPVQLRTNASVETMRPLDVEVTAGDLVQGQPGQPIEVTFDMTKPPTAVGAYLTEGQPAGASIEEGDLTLAAPGGTVIDSSFGCNVCISSNYVAVDWSATGDRALEPGTYTLTYEPSAEAGYGVGYLVETYKR